MPFQAWCVWQCAAVWMKSWRRIRTIKVKRTGVHTGGDADRWRFLGVASAGALEARSSGPDSSSASAKEVRQ
jgi:hypothetical protein